MSQTFVWSQVSDWDTLNDTIIIHDGATPNYVLIDRVASRTISS